MKNSLFLIFLAIGALTSCNTFKNAAFLTNNDLIHFIELNETYQDSIKLKTNSQGILNNKGLNESNTADFDLNLICSKCEALRARVQGNCKPKGGPCLELTREKLRIIVVGPRTNPLPIATFNLINNTNGSIISSTSKAVVLKNVASAYSINLPRANGISYSLETTLGGKTFSRLPINFPAPLLKN